MNLCAWMCCVDQSCVASSFSCRSIESIGVNSAIVTLSRLFSAVFAYNTQWNYRNQQQIRISSVSFALFDTADNWHNILNEVDNFIF